MLFLLYLLLMLNSKGCFCYTQMPKKQLTIGLFMVTVGWFFASLVSYLQLLISSSKSYTWPIIRDTLSKRGREIGERIYQRTPLIKTQDQKWTFSWMPLWEDGEKQSYLKYSGHCKPFSLVTFYPSLTRAHEPTPPYPFHLKSFSSTVISLTWVCEHKYLNCPIHTSVDLSSNLLHF